MRQLVAKFIVEGDPTAATHIGFEGVGLAVHDQGDLNSGGMVGHLWGLVCARFIVADPDQHRFQYLGGLGVHDVIGKKTADVITCALQDWFA